jgi:hypothetical protein
MTIQEPARSIDVVASADVIICGGGPAGVGAALASARNGMRTILIENQFCLGGMATAGMVNRLGPYHNQQDIILGGIPWEILRTLINRGLAQEPIICEPDNWMDYWLVFDPEGMKILLDELLLDAGVQIFFNTMVAAPIVNNNKIDGVIIESKSGRQAILGKIIIDATGDGDIAARAGAPFDIGRDGDNLLQPVTLFFKCLNMNWPKAHAYGSENYAALVEIAKKENGNDFILTGTDSYLHPEETYFNCLHEYNVDGTKVTDISKAITELRKKMWKNTEILHRYVPGCENVSLSTSASSIGIRETRRFKGAYQLTIDDVLNGRQFDDQTYRYACFVDIHEPEPGKKSKYSDRSLKPGMSYGIPYRCLLPKTIDNLLIAGRCFSATHEALASARMMPSCMAMGEAAGTAAAISIKEHQMPGDINVKDLQKQLRLQGVMI